MTRLLLTLLDGDAPRAVPVAVEQLTIAGWTGRDAAGVQAHIAELAALGVRPPAQVPVFYRVAAARVTTADTIQCTGGSSSGEAEFVLLRCRDRLWVGIGSDHTDRAVEAYGITVSKQMCDKPIGEVFWPLPDVAAHWDRLLLRSWADGVPYQDGGVAAMLAPRDLLAAAGELQEGGMLFGGTLPVLGGIRPAHSFAAELHDPVLDRIIGLKYTVESLRIVD